VGTKARGGTPAQRALYAIPEMICCVLMVGVDKLCKRGVSLWAGLAPYHL
jgi:hypothetical protein